MVSYIAHDKKSGVVFMGGLSQVADWSRDRIAGKAPKAIISIIKCRPESDGKVIAEFTPNGGYIVTGGRVISKREVMKLSRRTSDG